MYEITRLQSFALFAPVFIERLYVKMG